MSVALNWLRDGARWPHHEASRFVNAAGLRWHVQCCGSGPVALLIHGTGASTHSWRGLMPLLAHDVTVVAMDLPGHAFTGMPDAQGLSLNGMARSVQALIETLALDVQIVVGHSAGAAIGARLVLDGACKARSLVAINGALRQLDGLPGLVFPPIARLMASNTLAAQWFANRRWDRDAVQKLIEGTGSRLDDDGLSLYRMLVRDPRHVAGALGMMAAWDLRPLERDLTRLAVPMRQIVGADDRAVPPADAARVRTSIPASSRCEIDVIRGAGHLVHEERPHAVAPCVLAALHQGCTAPITS